MCVNQDVVGLDIYKRPWNVHTPSQCHEKQNNALPSDEKVKKGVRDFAQNPA